MTKPVFFVACCLFIGLSCSKSTTTAPPPPNVHLSTGLLVYLPFTGNMADSSGNNNTTTAVGGAALTADRNGNANAALGGGGAGQRVLVTNNGSIKFDTAFSVSIDIFFTTMTRYGFFNFVDNTNAESYVFGAGTPANPPYNLSFITANSNYTCGAGTSPSNTALDLTNFIPQTGIWYNMIFIFHKGELTSYVNGTALSSNTGGPPAMSICPSAKLIVGGWWDGDTQSVNGKMDNFRLYNRVLSSDEIAQLSKGF